MTPLVRAVYRARLGDEEKAAAELAERAKDYPIGHLGAVEDVANLALFLASDEAEWITGAVYIHEMASSRSFLHTNLPNAW